MTKVKSLNSDNYVNFQVSVFCVFFIKDKEGNYLDHEESGLKTENEEILLKFDLGLDYWADKQVIFAGLLPGFGYVGLIAELGQS